MLKEGESKSFLVLWAHRTTPKSTTNESPYSFVYRTKVVIPTNVISPTLRVAGEDQNAEALALSLDLLEEKKEQVVVRMAYY